MKTFPIVIQKKGGIAFKNMTTCNTFLLARPQTGHLYVGQF